jgi:hypothetical protein
LDEEVMAILSKWSKAAIIHCFHANGAKINLENNPALDRSLSSCMDEVVNEILTMLDERARELGSPSTCERWRQQ